MNYELEFDPQALKEWKKLDPSVREMLKRKLAERCVSPRNQAAALRRMPDCYKIKLRKIGYRLVYQVFDERKVLKVWSVGRRDKGAAYAAAMGRLDD